MRDDVGRKPVIMIGEHGEPEFVGRNDLVERNVEGIFGVCDIGFDLGHGEIPHVFGTGDEITAYHVVDDEKTKGPGDCE